MKSIDKLYELVKAHKEIAPTIMIENWDDLGRKTLYMHKGDRLIAVKAYPHDTLLMTTTLMDPEEVIQFYEFIEKKEGIFS